MRKANPQQMVFLPEQWFLCVKVKLINLALAIILVASPFLMIPKATAGMFGISIPANYGKWFTQIYQLYLDNQDLIANARKLYTAYLAVSNTIDALEGLNATDKETFTTRWARNMRTLLEAQIWFELDERIFEGRSSVNQLLQDILGIDFDQDGRATIHPTLVEMLAIEMAGDRSFWEGVFLDAQVPDLPSWFVTHDAFNETAAQFLERQEEMAFVNFQTELKQTVAQRIVADIANNPLRYLACENKTPCYTPFNLDSQASLVSWSWDQILENMYNLDLDLHNPMPLEGELQITEGLAITDYEQYLHRRVCSSVWRGMGQELKEKLTKTHLSFTRRYNELSATIFDIQNLVKVLEDLKIPLEHWGTQSGGSSAAMLIATSLSITADGYAEEQAKMESFLRGTIDKKIDTALKRSTEVKNKLQDTNTLLTSLLDQIAVEEGKTGHRSIVDGYINTRFAESTRSLRHSETPPHQYVGVTSALTLLSNQIAETISEDAP